MNYLEIFCRWLFSPKAQNFCSNYYEFLCLHCFGRYCAFGGKWFESAICYLNAVGRWAS